MQDVSSAPRGDETKRESSVEMHLSRTIRQLLGTNLDLVGRISNDQALRDTNSLTKLCMKTSVTSLVLLRGIIILSEFYFHTSLLHHDY